MQSDCNHSYRFLRSGDYVLNLRTRELGSELLRGRTFCVIFMPADRASGGKWARKDRQVLLAWLKGLNLVETSVMNLVIMMECSAVRDPR